MTQNLRLTGLTPSATVYLPNLSGIDWNQSFLNLGIWFSEILHPESSLAIFMNDELIYTQNLQRLPLRPGRPGTLRIPLNLFSPSPGEHMVKVEIKPTLFISQNHCEDLASGNLWMVLMKESHFLLNVLSRDMPASIDDFLLFPSHAFEIVLPEEEWTKEILTAYHKLMSFLHRLHAATPREISTMLYDEMTTEEKQDQSKRRMYLRSNSTRDYHLQGNRLYLTPEGVDGLVSPYRAAMTGRSGSVQLKPGFLSTYSPRLSFQDLGAGNLHFQGIGEMRTRIYFASSDLGGVPESLHLHLFENIMMPFTESGGDGFMKILFNEQIVLTRRLPDTPTGSLSRRIIDLSDHEIQRENTLEFVFSYFPVEGKCRAGTAPLEAFLSGDSFLDYHGKQPLSDPLTMQDVPTAFWGKGHVILPEQYTVQDIKAAALLASTLRSLDTTPLSFEVFDTQEGMELFFQKQGWLTGFGRLSFVEVSSFISPWQELARIPARVREQTEGKGNGINGWRTAFSAILTEYGKGLLRVIQFPIDTLFPARDPLPLPDYFLFIRPDFTLFPDGLSILPEGDSLILFAHPENIPLFTVTPDEPLAILSVSRQQERPSLFMTTLGQEDMAMTYFFQHFQGMETLRQLHGNVVLFTQEGWSDLVVSDDIGWQPASLPTWIDWYQNNRIPLYIILIALLFVFCLYLYFRLAHTGVQ